MQRRIIDFNWILTCSKRECHNNLINNCQIINYVNKAAWRLTVSTLRVEEFQNSVIRYVWLILIRMWVEDEKGFVVRWMDILYEWICTKTTSATDRTESADILSIQSIPANKLRWKSQGLLVYRVNVGKFSDQSYCMQ